MTQLILLLLLILRLELFSQNDEWRVLPIRSEIEYENGDFGGEGEQHPHSIARSFNNPDYIYLSQDVGGSWRSTDAGKTWNKGIDKGLFLQFGQSLEVDPNDPDIIFIIVSQSYNYKAGNYPGLYRSSDGGNSWEHVLHVASAANRNYQHNIAYNYSANNGTNPAQTWYAAFNDKALYRSDDGGKNWTGALSDLTGHLVYQVKTHPSNENVLYLCSDQGLFISSDKGASLSQVNTLPTKVNSIEIDPQDPNKIWVTVIGDGLYYSDDGGQNFTEFLYHNSVRVHINQGYTDNIYLIGSSRNSKMSTDAGQTWEDIIVDETFPGLGRENGWRRWIDGALSGLVPNPFDKDDIVAYSRSTLFTSKDAGFTFQESATGWTGNAWSWTDNSAVFHRTDPNKFAFFCNDVGTKITTTGGDWFEENTNAQTYSWYSQKKISWLGTYSGDFHPDPESEVMVASVGNYFKTQIMRTEDLGKTWELVTEGAANEEMHLFVAFNTSDPNIVYAGNKISKDGGKTFELIDFPEGYRTPYIIGNCKSYPEIVYAIDKDCKSILRSCDAGETWELYSTPGWSFKFFDDLPTFAVDPIDPKKIYTLDNKHDLAVFDGESWTSFNVMSLIENKIDYNYVRNVCVDPNDNSIIYAGMFGSGQAITFRSLDAGITWEDISKNLPLLPGPLKVNHHTGELYRGSLFGTWIFPSPYDEIPKVEDGLLNGIYITNRSINLTIGDTLTLTAQDLTGCLDVSNINWSSSDEAILSVDKKGKIEAMTNGKCQVIAIAQNRKDTVHVEVSPNTDVIESDEIKFSYITSILSIKSEQRIDNIEIFDLMGKRIINRSNIGKEITIDIGNNRMIFVRCVIGDKLISVRLMSEY